MSKRTWDEANHDSSPNSSPSKAKFNPSDEHVPSISRKVKACAACRKQKVRCLMNESGPPCQRCQEKGLSCVLNKSLQSLIDERLPSTAALISDVETVYSSLQTVLRTLNLPDLPALQSVQLAHLNANPKPHTPTSLEPAPYPDQDHELLPNDSGPSCDNSPKLSPEDECDLPRVPIQSVYHLTKLRALRSPDASHDTSPDTGTQLSKPFEDLISRNLIALPDAERLFNLFNTRLDNYMYNVGARYKTLSALRQASPILCAAILTVGAQHDPASNHIYPVCNKEFRRLMISSLFDRAIDRDHLRALCIASYWLNDASWMLSGIASRRAASFDISTHFDKVIQQDDPESADFVRIWYLIYICDQHLSTLYGRECSTREDVAVRGWERMVKAKTTTVGDLRLMSQVALLTIIHNIRELFGTNADKPVPEVYLTQIKGFARQLDQWVGYWSTTFPEYQEGFGKFPRKGALFHFHFAKLYLSTHIFRGLSPHTSIPTPFLETAHDAITAAVSIINMILTDSDVQAGLVGLPCYIQSMIGFACMFLAKVTSLQDGALIERGRVIDLVGRLRGVYKGTKVGRWHLVTLMVDGLGRLVEVLAKQGEQRSEGAQQGSGQPQGPVEGGSEMPSVEGIVDFGAIGQFDISSMNLDPFLMDPSMGVGMGMGLDGGAQPMFGDDFWFGGRLV